MIGRLAELDPADVVLEIGPGLGVLTRYLAERVALVHAVEIDRSLVPAAAAAAERPARARRRTPARPREPRAGARQARLQPPLQRRHADRRREPRRPADDRSLVRDGPARGRRPLLRRAGNEGVRRGLRARPPRGRAYGLPPGLAHGLPAAAERRLGARRVSPPRRFRPASPRSSAWSRERSPTAARPCRTRSQLAGVAERGRSSEALAALGRPPATRAEALAPDEFVELERLLQ